MTCYQRKKGWYFRGQLIGCKYRSRAIYKTKRECQQAERKERAIIRYVARHLTDADPAIVFGD